MNDEADWEGRGSRCDEVEDDAPSGCDDLFCVPLPIPGARLNLLVETTTSFSSCFCSLILSAALACGDIRSDWRVETLLPDWRERSGGGLVV